MQFSSPTKTLEASGRNMTTGLVVYRSIRIKDLPSIFWETLRHTIRIMFIIATAGFFGWLLILHRIPVQVITGLTALSSDYVVLMMIIIVILLIFGWFLKGIAVLLITIPIFQKIIVHFSIDPIQYSRGISIRERVKHG